MHKYATFIPNILFFIAGVVLLLGLFQKLSATNSELNEQTTKTMVKNTITPAAKKRNSSIADIDLVTSQICTLQTSKESTISAKIKNNKVAATLKTPTGNQYMILSDDCVYIWKTGMQGAKMCGVSFYLNILKNMNLSQANAPGNPLNLMKGLIQSPLPQGIDAGTVSRLLNTCVKESVSDEDFTVPQISFTEQKLF